MSSLRRQEEALVALSYPQVSYKLQGGYGGGGAMAAAELGKMLVGLAQTGMQTVSAEKQAEAALTANSKIQQAQILADVAVQQQLAAHQAAQEPLKMALIAGGVLLVGAIAYQFVSKG